MNWDETIAQMSWKKIIILIISAFLAVSVLRAALFMVGFNQAKENVEQTIAYQKNRLESIHQQFQHADQKTRQLTEETFASVEQSMDSAQKHMDDLHESMEKR